MLGTQIAVELSTSDGGSTSTADDDTHVFDGLADELQRIQQACTRDDSRTMLVVVRFTRDRELSLQTALDLKALRRLDILELMAPRWEPIALTAAMNASGSVASTSISKASTPE